MLFSFYIFGDTFILNYTPEDKYQFTIKTDYKIYVNGKYKGLHVKELKGLLNVKRGGNDTMHIFGNVLAFKKTFRNQGMIGYQVDKVEPCDFTVHKTGQFITSTNPVFPPMTNIPWFPDKNIKTGEVYKTYGKATVELLNTSRKEIINTEITIRYSGKKGYLKHTFDFFEATYIYRNPVGESDIGKARGKHNLELYFDNNMGRPVFIKDRFQEEFTLTNGDTVRHDGFNLYFYEIIAPMDKDQILEDLSDDIDKHIKKDLIVVKKPEGVSITLNNLKFKPNSTDLLPGEDVKIREIYEVLSKIKKRSFLVVGHTALAGTEAEQKQLSLERAQRIAGFLLNMGIPAERIFYEGRGASEPIAPNDTNENMQKNRRVEIIILED